MAKHARAESPLERADRLIEELRGTGSAEGLHRADCIYPNLQPLRIPRQHHPDNLAYCVRIIDDVADTVRILTYDAASYWSAANPPMQGITFHDSAASTRHPMAAPALPQHMLFSRHLYPNRLNFADTA
ncbi:hypothetical protein [Glutamicibacter arilaitensis]|uniref:Uncharacterized protein n=1 Tax=Glutamicibacter arilaitensis TaxID=256701 RepID=A0A2N7S627_9MICC|nr:hypothetical protein [Glutamicibacter arilaitensis]PMQ21599.1 hypothetical protein CIK84_08745 [Glutamicibacter arilaitensis]